MPDLFHALVAVIWLVILVILATPLADPWSTASEFLARNAERLFGGFWFICGVLFFWKGWSHLWVPEHPNLGLAFGILGVLLFFLAMAFAFSPKTGAQKEAA